MEMGDGLRSSSSTRPTDRDRRFEHAGPDRARSAYGDMGWSHLRHALAARTLTGWRRIETLLTSIAGRPTMTGPSCSAFSSDQSKRRRSPKPPSAPGRFKSFSMWDAGLASCYAAWVVASPTPNFSGWIRLLEW